jgi:catecholate siderophore receptor
LPTLQQIAANQAASFNGYAGTTHLISRLGINDVAAYVNDDIALNKYWKLDAGLRLDHYRTSFNAQDYQQGVASYNDLTTTQLSPRAALVFRPISTQSYYLSLGKSYDAANEYLTLAPGGQAVTPSSDKTIELGSKVDVLQGLLSVNAAAFHTTVSNARIADPDDPTLQGASHDTRVDGFELTALGYLNENWDIDASFTYLRDKVGTANIPADTAANYSNLPIAGMDEPNVAHATVSAWTVYDFSNGLKLGTGFNHVGKRWADFANSVVLPGYTVWSAMAAYQVNAYVGLQLNATNLTNTKYYTSAYYSDNTENHAVPGAGRTYTLTANFKY